MSLDIDKECWNRWHPVFSSLAAKYGFPAKSIFQLASLLRLHSGEGSTFRITGERWRFVIDVMRRGKDIVDIIAITLITRHNQDDRRNGAVIARACNIHPTPADNNRPGGPHLRWYPVTSGGEVYQHCCDKECTSPDKSGSTSRGTWETSRLRIIQKAYEQEALLLRQLYKEATVNASTSFQASQQDPQSMNAGVARSKETSTGIDTGSQEFEGFNHLSQGQSQHLEKQRRDEVASLRRDLQSANIETKALRARNIQLDKDNARKSATIENVQMEVIHVRRQKANLLLENNDQMARIREQRLLISDFLQKNQELQTEVTQHNEFAGLNKQLEAEKDTLVEQNEKLTNKQNNLIKSRQSLRDSNADLEAKMEKMERKRIRMDNKFNKLEAKAQSQEKQIATLTAANDEVNEVREANIELNENTAKLEGEKEEAIKISEGLVEQLTELENELLQSRTKVSQLWHDMELKNEHDRRNETALAEAQQDLKHRTTTHSNEIEKLKKDISAKEAITQRLQGEILCLQQRSQATPYTPRRPYGVEDEPPVSARELQYQRTISRQANEKASEMESKLDAMKLAMEAMKSELQTEKAEVNARKAEVDAKKAEVEALVKKCADKMNAANAKETYTVSLEKQLEELRGSMEGMLGRVSVYQGKKRRRTEGPDFQL
ncbi:hypothetical protein CORC01_13401 [Colletotrichum orchidophilum]|uniref:Uncharacterized protein n=1 Tax=Colletotrichum orchidophilum TaxID=1209926 RepID=A0A1G4AQA3_9PEZI|nr:uncharacterized protein CORC01_13401 [Colletotrichum orchidophilum]OHE91286.1 hypothetical protein CORC01_13401 [Colletotrichum orchidophilum]